MRKFTQFLPMLWFLATVFVYDYGGIKIDVVLINGMIAFAVCALLEKK